ncbi:hypothetical protein [Azospirillum argentinense]
MVRAPLRAQLSHANSSHRRLNERRNTVEGLWIVARPFGAAFP